MGIYVCELVLFCWSVNVPQQQILFGNLNASENIAGSDKGVYFGKQALKFRIPPFVADLKVDTFQT
jgi:hypothetical protein